MLGYPSVTAVSFAEYMAIRNAYLKRMEENQCEQK